MKLADFTILLVEDDPNDVLLTQRAFVQASLVNPLRVVMDGDAALDYLSGRAPFDDRTRYPIPSLVLLDLKLPRRSGLEVLKWMREQPDLKSIPVIILTSSQQSLDVDKAYALGANSYLVKPVGFDGLLEMVKAIGMYWVLLNRTPAGSAPRPPTELTAARRPGP